MNEHITLESLDARAAELWKEYGGRELSVKERRAIPQQDMPAQNPLDRRANMSEVAMATPRIR